MTTIAVEYERHKGPLKKDGLYEGYGIYATKTIAAPLTAVYSAWTDTSMLSRWFGAGTQAAVQEDGTYSNNDGDSGKYLRVRLSEDLRFTWENAIFSSAWQVDVTLETRARGKR